MKEPPHPPLAADRVSHVGDQVAVVVAESVREAKDAAELVEVDYEVQTPVADMKTALAAKELVHDDAPGNLCYDWEFPGPEAKAEVDAAFQGAAKTVRVDLYNNRLTPNAIEPRAAIGEYDPASGKHTLYTTSQNPHVIRLLMGAFVLKIPEHKLRIVAPDVGGGFGSKIYHYAEEAVVTWAARKVGRPVKWTADRAESFVTDAQGARPPDPRRTGPGRQREIPGPAGGDHGEHGGLPVDFRPVDSDLSLRHPAGGDLRHAENLVRRQGGLHQHGAGGRLPRRRPPRGEHPAGAAGGTRPRAKPASTGWKSGGKTSFRPTPFRTKPRWRCSTIPATFTPWPTRR